MHGGLCAAALVRVASSEEARAVDGRKRHASLQLWMVSSSTGGLKRAVSASPVVVEDILVAVRFQRYMGTYPMISRRGGP
jgi:hypothetical protein